MNDTAAVAQVPQFGELLDATPLPLAVYDRQGLLVAMNETSAALWGVARELLVGSFNIVEDSRRRGDDVTPLLERTLAGHKTVLEPAAFDTSTLSFESGRRGVIWTQTTIFPIYSADRVVTHFGVLRRDVTDMVAQQRDMDAAQQTLAEQQQVIESLSMPVVQVWDGILLVPLVGTIDARRSASITETLLLTIGQQQAEIAIIDITGVPVVDTYVAQYLISTTRAAQLLGCQTALVGIRGEIAQSIVQLGIDLSNLKTLANLRVALQWALAQRGLIIDERSARAASR
jgi:rsbT co-antagonist protein RsbR